MVEKRIIQEIKHGEKIASNAEFIWRWDSPTGIIRSERRANFFVQFGQIDSDKSVLEIGCGTGLFTKRVNELTNSKVTAIDISETLISIAKTKVPSCKFMRMDAMNMIFQPNLFDVVYGSSILHHLHIETALNEIHRVLKPAGKIVFAEPNMLNPHIFLQKNIPVLKRYWGDIPDESAIIRWRLKELLLHRGFININIIPYDFLYPMTPVKLIPFVCRIGRKLEKIPIIKEIAGSVLIFAEKRA